jgi:hypothetical protein
MRRALTFIGLFLLAALALYGAFMLISNHLTQKQGQAAGEAVSPFVSGFIQSAGEQVRETLRTTSDEQIQQDAELYTKKFYPAFKGAVKGLSESLNNDPRREEITRQAYETGRQVGQLVVEPFSRGVTDGAGPVLHNLQNKAEEIRNFTEQNKDILNAVSGGLQFLQKALKNAPGPPHPQGIPPGGPLPAFPPQPSPPGY